MIAAPGTQVTWAEPHPDDPADEIGMVLRPTWRDRLYFWRQRYPKNRCVLVEWNGERWNTAWHDPSELRPLP